MTTCVKKPHNTEKSTRREISQRTGWKVRKFNQMEEPCSGYLKSLQYYEKINMKFKFLLGRNYSLIYFSYTVLNVCF